MPAVCDADDCTGAVRSLRNGGDPPGRIGMRPLAGKPCHICMTRPSREDRNRRGGTRELETDVATADDSEPPGEGRDVDARAADHEVGLLDDGGASPRAPHLAGEGLAALAPADDGGGRRVAGACDARGVRARGNRCCCCGGGNRGGALAVLVLPGGVVADSATASPGRMRTPARAWPVDRLRGQARRVPRSMRYSRTTVHRGPQRGPAPCRPGWFAAGSRRRRTGAASDAPGATWPASGASGIGGAESGCWARWRSRRRSRAAERGRTVAERGGAAAAPESTARAPSGARSVWTVSPMSLPAPSKYVTPQKVVGRDNSATVVGERVSSGEGALGVNEPLEVRVVAYTEGARRRAGAPRPVAPGTTRGRPLDQWPALRPVAACTSRWVPLDPVAATPQPGPWPLPGAKSGPLRCASRNRTHARRVLEFR